MVGATGNIGTALLDALVADADITRIRALARRVPERRWEKTAFESVDLTRDDLRRHVRGADAVVHLGWIFQPTHHPLRTWEVNVVGSMRLFDAVVAEGVSTLVYSSSVGAYSPGTGDHPVDESWPTNSLPTAGYGREKSYLERVLDAVEARNPELRVVRLRPGFVFQHDSGTQQRRLFAGPFAPATLLRPGLLPVVPFPAGLRFQALHASDAAQAFHLAINNDRARGAFNIAADPVIDAGALGDVLGAKPVVVPSRLVRGILTPAWWAHLVPAEPALFDLAMGLPLMQTERARTQLAWSPRISATDALRSALFGMSAGAGGDTPPLEKDSVRGRAHEVAAGVGRTA